MPLSEIGIKILIQQTNATTNINRQSVKKTFQSFEYRKIVNQKPVNILLIIL